MKILILNAGSSSLKYQLIDMDGEKLLAKGLVERIGIEGSHINQKANGQVFDATAPMANHTEGIQWMLKALLDPEKGALKSMDEIGAVGHRVLHGGGRFTASVLVNDEVKEAIKANIPLGPLHNPANLMGIEACEKVMPGTPNVAVFDTAFHQTMPPKAYLYGVPMEYYEKLHVRRYGFHGTSHRYVSKRVCEFLGVDRSKTRVITCHLGNGSSMCAVENGKCIDTSMGITPLEGVIMGTRSGSMDPAVVQYICNNEHISVDEMLTICNKKSGLLGISGLSSDMRDIDKAADEGNERANIARDMLVYGIRKYIGSYAAAMNGVDVIVFTAGIGENNCALRERVMQGFEYLGAKLDPVKNAGCREEAVISTDDSKVKICVIPTDEEIVIARDTLCIVTGKPIE
ncbi:acetate/propionate family kinase [Desulfovibrio piger]|uniref:acetate/propionate family kinase n=1 Tax=Desulfovibrio piger TaxID=901 RepID=UPI0026F0E81F|nr:acetate kinase [Desulfovibrio piger]